MYEDLNSWINRQDTDISEARTEDNNGSQRNTAVMTNQWEHLFLTATCPPNVQITHNQNNTSVNWVTHGKPICAVKKQTPSVQCTNLEQEKMMKDTLEITEFKRPGQQTLMSTLRKQNLPWISGKVTKPQTPGLRIAVSI